MPHKEEENMPIVEKKIIELAIKNIASHGDTDIFPYPTENHLLHDKPKEVTNVLMDLDKNFKDLIISIPVLTSKNLSAVGYNGFRYGTQIDPLWNAYLLALVLTVAEDLEKKRVSKEIVFSYRYAPDLSTGSLFDKSVGWHEFQTTAIKHAQEFPFILRCDISDFYPRIYHHRLENAIKSATTKGDATLRILDLVSAIAEGPSYGLPVGGAASRILSETLLNRVDRLLMSEGIKFCRFVDDYIIFTTTKEAAHSALIKLSSLLLSNEGLSLQKTKTRILSAAEFLSTSEFSEPADIETKEEQVARTFRRLRVHYDPYSPTAEDDYEKLKIELQKFDIVGMLARELTKSKVDEGLTRRLISAIRHLNQPSQNEAILSMLKSIDLLYPIFPAVMLLCKHLIVSINSTTQSAIFQTIRELILSDSYITQVPTNLAFALRVLVHDEKDEAEFIFASVYKKTSSMLIKRDVILLMAYRRAEYWISDCQNKFSTLTAWERRALLIASYTLRDEGSHWRDSIKTNLNAYEKLILTWTGDSKSAKGNDWRVPL
jgi:hypothetical protein